MMRCMLSTEQRCSHVIGCCDLSGKCSTGEYECVVGNICMTSAQLCDGIQHCPDGSDEDWRADCALSSTAGIQLYFKDSYRFRSAT